MKQISIKHCLMHDAKHALGCAQDFLSKWEDGYGKRNGVGYCSLEHPPFWVYMSNPDCIVVTGDIPKYD